MLRFSLRVLPKFMPLKPFLIEFRQNTKKKMMNKLILMAEKRLKNNGAERMLKQ